MRILLTGATGAIGSAVLGALQHAGYNVTALVHSDTTAHSLASTGADVLVGDLADTSWLQHELARFDGVVHTESPSDEERGDVDRSVVDAATSALAGSFAPIIHTGTMWSYGAGDAIHEHSPKDPPDLVSWREPIERTLLDSEGVRGIVIVPGVFYGHGTGLVRMLTNTRTAKNEVRLPGPGTQHWATVHVDDLAALYVRALENAPPGSTYLGANPGGVRVHDVGEAIAALTGAPGVHAQTPDQLTERVGREFAEALLLDQQVADATRARSELGWIPQERSLLDDLRRGAYTIPA